MQDGRDDRGDRRGWLFMAPHHPQVHQVTCLDGSLVAWRPSLVEGIEQRNNQKQRNFAMRSCSPQGVFCRPTFQHLLVLGFQEKVAKKVGTCKDDGLGSDSHPPCCHAWSKCGAGRNFSMLLLKRATEETLA